MQKFKPKITTFAGNSTKTLLVMLGLILILFCLSLPALNFYWKLCTEQDRKIPPNTEVLVSSCKRPTVIGVPGGEVLFVYEGLTGKMYLLDLSSGEQGKIPNYPLLDNKERIVFLDPNLVWIRPNNILDLTDGQSYELFDLMSLPRLEGNNFNPENYSYVQSAERVFIDLKSNNLIALSTDFRTNQNGRVILTGYISEEDEFLLELVNSLGMDYENIDSSTSGPRSNMPSPTGNLYVLNNGIYSSGTNEVIDGIPYAYYFRSWYYDESGVVIHDNYGTYWILTQFFGDYYHLFRPVLKLRLPGP